MSWVWFLLSGVCHQLPEHSLHCGGQPLPLCARCTGAFVGLAAGLATLVIMGRGRRVGLPSHKLWPWLGLLLVAWAFDGINALLNDLQGGPWLYAPSLSLRLVTGIGAGLALATFLYPIAQYALWQQVREEPVLDRLAQLVPLLLVGGGIVAVLMAGGSLPWAMVAGVTVISTGLTFVIANGALVSLLAHERGTAEWLWQGWPYGLAGLALSLIEMGAVALLRRWLSG